MRRQKAVKVLEWTPVRDGDRYCSPACGYGCTNEMYLDAVKAGEKLEQRLGPGWKASVWENLGWYCRVSKGPMSVAPSYGGYTAIFDQWIGSSRGPRTAVDKVLNQVRAEVSRLVDLLEAMDE